MLSGSFFGAPLKVGDKEMVREELMLKVLDGLLESNDMPLACEVPLYGSRGTFRGPVFQLSMLRRVSSRWRFGLLVSN